MFARILYGAIALVVALLASLAVGSACAQHRWGQALLFVFFILAASVCFGACFIESRPRRVEVQP